MHTGTFHHILRAYLRIIFIPIAEISVHAFGTLTHKNALARLELSDLYEALTVGRQNAFEDGSPALRCLAIGPQQTFGAKVLYLKL